MNKKTGKGKLFISGGGGAQDSFLLDQEFVKSSRLKRILYIPIALQRDSIGYEACYDWITSTLSNHSDDFIEIMMWLDLKNKTIDDLKKIDAIYIGGGNTYKLLQIIYEENFDKVLAEFLRRGGNIYGGSAGA
ncbi:Type 1 glutamine amidotransferase-like domain-containing protein, partial [Patescibacteria group bacterium]|nr:Type 1 glutamine amidotransferase-like domain-containing protein [Patescibacteria group bacterium]